MIHSLKKWLMAGAVFVNATTVAVAKETSPVPEAAQKGDRVLVVVTNRAKYPSRDDATGVWLTELTHFVDVFRTAGIEMDFVSPEGGAMPIDYVNTSIPIQKKYLYDENFMNKLERTYRPEELNFADYAAVYYSGGGAAMFGVAENRAIQKLVVSIYENNGLVSAVCHGTVS